MAAWPGLTPPVTKISRAMKYLRFSRELLGAELPSERFRSRRTCAGLVQRTIALLAVSLLAVPASCLHSTRRLAEARPHACLWRAHPAQRST